MGNRTRDALVRSTELLKRIVECRPETGVVFQDLIRVNEAVLSEPVLNCNLYSTIGEAEAAFLNEACKNPCGNCSVSKDSGSVLVHECGIKWLFSVAPQGGEK